MQPQHAPAAVQVEGLRHRFGGAPVLSLPALALAAGEQAVVVGPSGCGKTTLLSLLAGLMLAAEGRVSVGGHDLASLARQGSRALDRFRARSIGLVPQQPLLFGVLDSLDNLLAARHFAGLPVDRDGALRLLADVGLRGLEHRRPGQLSRGQQQRVALARALVNRPALILADEPTANLDDANAAQAIGLLRERAAALGATLLIATHDARVRVHFERVIALDATGAEA
jgi:putative ABC transport system ATP-binding protein